MRYNIRESGCCQNMKRPRIFIDTAHADSDKQGGRQGVEKGAHNFWGLHKGSRASASPLMRLTEIVVTAH